MRFTPWWPQSRTALGGLMAPMVASALFAVTPLRLAHAQSSAISLWRDAESGVDVRITRDASGTLTGRIAAIRDSVDANGQPPRDTKNADASLRSRPIFGLPMLTGMRAESTTTWDKGAIYDARSGKTYKANMRLTHADTLKIKGYVQVGFVKIGRTVAWVRIADAAGAQ